jgi:hypothetical protein
MGVQMGAGTMDRLIEGVRRFRREVSDVRNGGLPEGGPGPPST